MPIDPVADMKQQNLEALRRTFGYAPDERDGEQWVVYQDRVLIVIHPERRPRLYKRGALGAGDYTEVEPLW